MQSAYLQFPDTTADDSNGIMADIVVDHLYRPYCSGFRRVKQVERSFSNVEVRSFNACSLMNEQFRLIPSHVADALLAGEPRSLGAAFFVNGNLVARGPRAETLEDAIQCLGGARARDAAVWHSQFSQMPNAPPGVHIRRITSKELSNGFPLPVLWCELNPASECGTRFLPSLTNRFNCIMAGAYVYGWPAGFITFFPGEECEHLPPRAERSRGALRITCLHVFPRYRRQGVATALITEAVNIAKERACERVIVHCGWIDIGERFSGACAGSKSPYIKLGFRILSGSEPNPSDPSDDGRANLEYRLCG